MDHALILKGSRTAKTQVGKGVLRSEDRGFLTGRGCYTDDLQVPSQLHTAILRPPEAHADIRHLDIEAVRPLPDAPAVFTGPD